MGGFWAGFRGKMRSFHCGTTASSVDEDERVFDGHGGKSGAGNDSIDVGGVVRKRGKEVPSLVRKCRDSDVSADAAHAIPRCDVDESFSLSSFSSITALCAVGDGMNNVVVGNAIEEDSGLGECTDVASTAL
jgi:hypothetical protein